MFVTGLAQTGYILYRDTVIFLYGIQDRGYLYGRMRIIDITSCPEINLDKSCQCCIGGQCPRHLFVPLDIIRSCHLDDLLAQIAQRSVEQRLEVVDVAPHECDVDRVGYVRNHRIPPREDRKAAEVVRCRMLPVCRRIVQDVDAVDQTEGLAVAGRQRQIDLRAAVALDHVEIVEDRRLEDQRRRIFQIAQLTVYVELLRHSVKCFIESSTTQSCMQAFVREMSPSST